MAFSRKCPFPPCSNDFPISRNICPHCGLPSHFPNVDVAQDENPDLLKRYSEAIADANARGVIKQVRQFEAALEDSAAVSNKKLPVLVRVCEEDNELFSNYYQLSKSVTLQNNELWDPRRQSTDPLFFTGYHEELSFAALTIDDTGLPNYGDCSVVYRTYLIAHRASLFEENTTAFRIRERIVEADEIPKGHRSTWNDRVMLCIAKLEKAIDTTLTPDKYSSLLMSSGATGAKDKFVEVHIYGPITIRTVGKITFTVKKRNKAEQAIIKSIKNKAGYFGVTVV
jgi:hypothetical protein